ncbi:MAG TPA: helix-turn-helix transcriptional regulator [Planctomycetaceae bacterium]|nr:helix-turn-helix transcriptional regulator [Planctomycetaceae bacterium]HQZ67248.1 helix-turn-helix transcriptional regulator [Planctomycetaceae bacterium]HRA88677.1 helix-turn-helix transcriptional regulator [Planctomycetaceae bacterium]
MDYSGLDFNVRHMKRKRQPEKSIYTDEYAIVLNLLKEARRNSGVTQIDLADRLGQTQSFVSKIERGDRRLDIVQLRTILLEFGVTLPDFVIQLESEIAKQT